MIYIRNNFKKVYRVGYCELEYIYRYEEPQYYNSGVYGWNCDIYIDYSRDIAITTGYRNMAGKVIPSDILKKYSDIAEDIIKNMRSLPYDEVKTMLDKNKEDFLNELNKL
jgi:hypothetical protein